MVVCSRDLLALTDNCGVTRNGGAKVMSGPQGVSTQSMNLQLGEDIELELTVMIKSGRDGRK